MKGCHSDDNEKNGATTMFRLRQLIKISVQKKQVCGCAEHARDGGGIPITGFPRVDGMANEEERARINSGHGPNIGCISYNTCIRSTDVVSGLYL